MPTGEAIEKAEKIPATTNIVAEHLAIQLSLELALENGITHLTVLNDSQVPVRQVQGKYQIKQDHILPLVEKTWELGQQFESVEIDWVPREHTSRPDHLCRQIDKPWSPRKRPGPSS